MSGPCRSRHVVVAIGLAALASGASCSRLDDRAERRVIDAGFWFEPVNYDSRQFGEPVTAQEVETIASIANSELTTAFAGFPIRFVDRRDATYQVRVVQELRDLRFSRNVWIAGESRAVPGFGGRGAVSFSFLADGAIAYSPADASRSSMIEAIGRGIGRSAVHEFAHQFLPTTPIHGSTDVQGYEYPSATRREQYFGDMHWDLAWAPLQERFGR
jgi:elongation factor P hydroxylase